VDHTEVRVTRMTEPAVAAPAGCVPGSNEQMMDRNRARCKAFFIVHLVIGKGEPYGVRSAPPSAERRRSTAQRADALGERGDPNVADWAQFSFVATNLLRRR
jgi:hypothetical protein